jgi:L-2-hydroxyglutarate oxidase LhgO
MGTNAYDVVIVGGGFYGLRIAQFMAEELKVKKILVIEKDADVMSRASYNNQARVHNGYHYPRSILTALRSRVNLPIFTKEYEAAIVKDFDKYYAIARTFSKVSAHQFQRFYERIGAEIEVAPQARNVFDSKFIEEVFKVKEYAFNSTKIKQQLLERLNVLGIKICTNLKAEKLEQRGENIYLTTSKATYKTKFLINSTYSSINHLNESSGLPSIPLKHEITEMCLVKMPQRINHMAFTVMCGPFFSLMPFPDKGDLYTMSHVRYTPHSEWYDSNSKEPKESIRDEHDNLKKKLIVSHFPQMIADIKRYMPIAKDITYSGESLWEVKTVLPKSESDDSRPIMYQEHYGGIKNYICIMGGKIDNIYDVFRELKETYAQAG